MVETSYFPALGGQVYRAVSLVYQQPPGFHLPVAEELAPPLGMYFKFRKGKMSEAQFAQIYKGMLDLLDPEDIAKTYDGKILVSWEGYADRKKTRLKFSHRHIVAEWLNKAGFECKEVAGAGRGEEARVSDKGGSGEVAKEPLQRPPDGNTALK